MTDQIEDRIERLERFRYSALARINACQSIAVGAWGQICLQKDDPVQFAISVTDAWKKGATTLRPFPGVDPAHLELLSQEYQEAIDALSNELLAHVGRTVAK